MIPMQSLQRPMVPRNLLIQCPNQHNWKKFNPANRTGMTANPTLPNRTGITAALVPTNRLKQDNLKTVGSRIRSTTTKMALWPSARSVHSKFSDKPRRRNLDPFWWKRQFTFPDHSANPKHENQPWQATQSPLLWKRLENSPFSSRINQAVWLSLKCKSGINLGLWHYRNNAMLAIVEPTCFREP